MDKREILPITNFVCESKEEAKLFSFQKEKYIRNNESKKEPETKQNGFY